MNHRRLSLLSHTRIRLSRDTCLHGTSVKSAITDAQSCNSTLHRRVTWDTRERVCDACQHASINLSFDIVKRYPTVLHLEFAIWVTWQMREQTWQKCQVVDDFANLIARVKSHVRKARVPGDLLFLSFAKSKCQFPWRWPIFILCILLWEFANSNKCQVNLPKPLEML